MGNQSAHPKLFEVDEEIRILQDAVNDAKLRRETIFYKLSHHKTSDDSMYKMVFAYYKDKVVFRYGSLPMIKDQAYHEMFGKDNQ